MPAIRELRVETTASDPPDDLATGEQRRRGGAGERMAERERALGRSAVTASGRTPAQ